MKKITRSELVLAGIAILGIAYTPVAKPRPSVDILNKYITSNHTSKWKYSPEINRNDMAKSEARKQQLLSDIRSIRAQIRKQANELSRHTDIESYDQLQRVKEARLDKYSEQAIVEVTGLMHTRTCHRIHEVMTKRAEELRMPRKYLSQESVLRKKGMVVIDMEIA